MTFCRAGVIELFVLRQIGLHDAQPHIVDETSSACATAAMRRKPAISSERQHAERERQPAPPGIGCVRRRASPGSQRSQPRAASVPTGRTSTRFAPAPAARSARSHSCSRESRDSTWPRSHSTIGQRGGEARECASAPRAQIARASAKPTAVKIASPAGKRRDRESAAASRRSWRRPGRRGRSSRGRRGNSRSRKTSRRWRRRNSAEAAGGRAVDQPDRDRKGQEQDRPGIERRERQHRQRRRPGMRSRRGASPRTGPPRERASIVSRLLRRLVRAGIAAAAPRALWSRRVEL